MARPAPAPRPASPPPPPSQSEMDDLSALRPLEPSEAQHARGDTADDMPERKTHAGLVGLFCFVLFAGILLSPFVPGKILENFPGSSQSLSSGEQAIACLDDLENVRTNTAYTIKLGSPVIYRYSTTTTQQATCGGKPGSATIGSTAQFNPLGLLADLLLALIVAVGIGKLWSLIARRRRR